MKKKQKKRIQRNHLIVLLMAIVMMIICAPAAFAGSNGSQGEHGAIVDVEYTPAEAFYYYEEVYNQWDGYKVYGEVNPDDSVKVIYEDGTIADCAYYDKLSGVHNWKTPEGLSVEVDEGNSNQSNDCSWNDPSSEKLLNIWITVRDNGREVLSTSKQLPVSLRESPVESITYTQVAGIPVRVFGFDNYKPSGSYSSFIRLSETVRANGDSITVKYKNNAKPVKYVRQSGKWIAADGSLLQHVSFNVDCEDGVFGEGYEYPKYEPGRYVVGVNVLGAETEYCFDVIDDPVKSIAFTPSTIVVDKAEIYEPESNKYYLANRGRDNSGSAFAEGDALKINYKDGSVGRYTYDDTTDEFYDASGKKLPYRAKLTMRMVKGYEAKEGLNQNAVEIQYGLNHIQVADLIIEDGHNMELDESTAVAPTCTKPGKKADRICHAGCGSVEVGAVIPALGHKMVKTAAKAATTKAAGNKLYYTCNTCGKHFKDAKGLTAYGENEWVIPKLKVQKVTVKTTAKKVKVRTLKKKAITVAPLRVIGSKGTVTYKVVGGTAKAKKALRLNTKTGKVTVKKQTKKGTYTIKVKVTAKAVSGYAAFAKNVNVIVKVK